MQSLLDVSNSFDFEIVGDAFESPAEKLCFEKLTSVIENIWDNTISCCPLANEISDFASRDLCFLKLYNFIETRMKKVSCQDFINGPHGGAGPKKDLGQCKRIKHNKYNKHSFYDAYIILKYIMLPEEKKNLLCDTFRLDTCDPFVMYRIRNDEFVQSFFSVVTSSPLLSSPLEENVTQKLDYIQNFDFHNPHFVDEMILLSWTVNGLIKKFQCIEMKFKYIFYVTQHIVFDKTNFEKDFVTRYQFAKTICVQRHNQHIFSPLLSLYHDSAYLKSVIQQGVLNDSGLPMAVRRLYYDTIEDFDKWTYTNFAKKMDSTLLEPYVSEYFNKCKNDKVIEYYVEKEFLTLKVYSEYMELYEKIKIRCMKNKLYGQEYIKFFEFCGETVKKIPFRKETLEGISNAIL